MEGLPEAVGQTDFHEFATERARLAADLRTLYDARMNDGDTEALREVIELSCTYELEVEDDEPIEVSSLLGNEPDTYLNVATA